MLDGSGGDDTIQGMGGADTLDGGSGNDTLSYAASTAGVTVSLAVASQDGIVQQKGGDAEGDTLLNFDHVVGSAKNDVLTGEDNDDAINRADGGAGDDLINVGLAGDQFFGGTGIDTLSFALLTGPVTANLSLQGKANAARNAIGDNGDEQRLIRTIARKGFRFAGDVSEAEKSADPAPPAAAAPGPQQEIHFCTAADGVRIAYALAGQGPPLIKCANWLNHVEYDWQSPIWSHLLHALAAEFRLIRYDERDALPMLMRIRHSLAPDRGYLGVWIAQLERDVPALERFATGGQMSFALDALARIGAREVLERYVIARSGELVEISIRS